MRNLIEYRCGLIDFQVGRDHGKLSFDSAAYISECAKSGMKRVMFTCKDAYGDAYYKSDLVEQNTMADDDYLGTALRTAHEKGMELYAYYNVFLDDAYAEAYPEHRMIDDRGKPVISYDYYKSLCPNSPYMDIVRERISDLVFNYEVDGLFLDITYFRNGTCFCGFCKEEFMESYGYELKKDFIKGTSQYADFNEFRRISRARILTNIAESVREIRTIPVIWNGSGSMYLAEPETDWFSDYYTTEFHAPDYLDGIIRAKWMQSREKDFIISTPSELGSWGDWTMIPEITLKSVLCSIAAHGGGVYINHTPYPSGTYAKSFIQPLVNNVESVFQYLNGFEDQLRGAKSCADIAVLFSIEAKRFWENGFGPEGFEYFKSLKGAVRMLLSSGNPFDVIDEYDLIESRGYKVLVIPGAMHLKEETVEFLSEFVHDGANLLIAGEFASFDESGNPSKLPDFLGAINMGYSELSVEYFVDLDETISSGIPDMPILIKKAGRLSDTRASEEAGVLAYKCNPPFEAEIGRHVYHQHAHPFEKTEFAELIQNDYGKGKCMYFPSDIFKSYYETASPWLMKIVHNCVDVLNLNPCLRVEAPECVFTTLMENSIGYLLQIVNINGPIPEPSKVFPAAILTIPEIKIKTSLEFREASIVAADEETDLETDNELLVIKNAGLHTAVILKK